MIRYAITLLGSVSLAACAIPASPPAVAPKPPASLGLTGAVTPAIDAEWWRSFGDPQLDRLITDATAGSPTLEVALARVRIAEATLASRRADNGPNVTLDSDTLVQRFSERYIIPPPYGGSTRFVGTVGANLAWNLDLFGRQAAAIAQARASTDAARLDAAAARLELAGAVAQSYVDLARAERQAAIAQRTIGTRQGSLNLVRVQVRNQLASKLDSTAAETLLAQARAALVRAQGQRALAVDALAALAGRGPDYAAAIGPVRLDLDTLAVLPTQVPADLLARRADIAAAQARVEAAAAGRQVARRAFYPNVNLAALAGLQAIGLGNLFSLSAGTLGAGPAVHLPLFDNGRLKADLAGATGALDLATADYNDRVVGAVKDAADAIALGNNLQAQRARQREVVRGFAETGRLNNIRVSSGLDSKLNLVDNDIRLLEAEQADADLAADAAQQRVALILALGGGFVSRDNQP